MKKLITILLLSLSLLSLSACNTKKDAATTKSKETTVSTTVKKKAKKKKESSAKTTKTKQPSSSQTVQTPETPPAEQPIQNQQQVQTPEGAYVDPNQSNQTPQTPAFEQPAQNVDAPATNNWMTPDQRNDLIMGGKFDPAFVDSLSQSDYQLAADRAQQRLEETGYGDVTLVWHEIYKMYPESTTLFNNNTPTE